MKFIGHLDIMRYFQKVMRRADVDIRYSEGFSPHQIMSFAAPLGVGLTSNGEYMDIEVLSTDDSKTMVRRMNETMVEGMEVVSYRQLDDSSKNAMSIVAAADYTLTFRPGKEPEDLDGFFQKLEAFYHQDQILITKPTKKGERQVDLKPLIYQMYRTCCFYAGFHRKQQQHQARTGDGGILPQSWRRISAICHADPERRGLCRSWG